MPEISAKDVMALRNKTGLSMMECKKALEATSGDASAAEDHLRKLLKGKMDTRTERAAGEGRLAIAVDPSGRAATIVELRAETDFTAKNEKFLEAVKKISEMALQGNAGAVTPTAEMTKMVDDIRITTGENASIARIHKLEGTGSTMFGQYVHHDGKKAALLQMDGDVSQDMARSICMHIVSAVPAPKGISANDVPAHIVEKERKFRLEQAMESGKPKEIAEKMVEGGMRKFFEEIALLEQPFVMDPTKKVREMLPKGASVTAFLRWQVGEEAGA
ncbi:MAG TPA: translation elongation factor Ts [Phycisphaerales bacterium]|nr:translation elongation factor Ts [Phycisphaerales bacterium]